MKKLFVSLFLFPCFAIAAEYGKIVETKRTSLKGFIGGVQDYFLGLAGGAAILFIVWGGFLYITSRGNKAQAEKAKKNLTYAVGGLILIILAGVITRIITDDAIPAIIN